MTPPPPATVILSPHFDDAVLSLAGLIPALDAPVTVVTAYGGAPRPEQEVSWWDTTCGFSSGGEAHRARVTEDTRACELLGVERVVLGHPDGPYGDGGPLHEIDTYLAGLTPDTRLLIPLGTNQADHTKVRDRALRVLGELGRPLPLVYADLPYTGHLKEWGSAETDTALAGSEDFGVAYRDIARRYRTRTVHDLTLSDEQWAAKRAAVLCYASQLAPLAIDHGSVMARGGPLRAERVWALEEADSPEESGS
ncbi:PIG-L deacetylase family protein [Streptomyces sp. NPDC102274]|uniref:PIG-L deacetylase family protein n=1 Tax=Streptomyces sp. NPDC102274 TaxID=3366151 RepID=UPI0038261F12